MDPRRPSRRRRRSIHHWARLDLLGLHRRKREAIRALQSGIETLRHLVGMLDQLAMDVFADDEPDHLRGAATMMRGIMAAATDIAGRLGDLRFMAAINHITLEEPDDEELGDEPVVKDPEPRNDEGEPDPRR